MRGERRRNDRDILRDCWGRWTAILSLFARRRPARRRLAPRAYAALRKELIAACQSLVEADGPEQAFYASLEETVKPWLNLRVLERTDREILSGLLLHCREVERQLNRTRWRLALTPPVERTMAIAAVGAVTGSLVWFFPMESRSVLNSLRDAIDSIWLMIKFADNWQKWSAFAVIVVLASMYIVSRSARA